MCVCADDVVSVCVCAYVGVRAFTDVVGVAGRTAVFYVCVAFATGSDVNGAVSAYYEAEGRAPPANWSPPPGVPTHTSNG